MTSISFDNARKYCEWLAKETGKAYRLGTEEEMEKFLSSGKGGNTLDTWAGYSPNPDDAARLSSRIEGLGPGALLRPVGSFAGAGEEPVFDLDGNATEWVVTKDGTGKAMGASADRPSDAKGRGAARPDYVGFRVVLK